MKVVVFKSTTGFVALGIGPEGLLITLKGVQEMKFKVMTRFVAAVMAVSLVLAGCSAGAIPPKASRMWTRAKLKIFLSLLPAKT